MPARRPRRCRVQTAAVWRDGGGHRLRRGPRRRARACEPPRRVRAADWPLSRLVRRSAQRGSQGARRELWTRSMHTTVSVAPRPPASWRTPTAWSGSRRRPDSRAAPRRRPRRADRHPRRQPQRPHHDRDLGYQHPLATRAGTPCGRHGSTPSYLTLVNGQAVRTQSATVRRRSTSSAARSARTHERTCASWSPSAPG